jgi:hypothetical protein
MMLSRDEAHNELQRSRDKAQHRGSAALMLAAWQSFMQAPYLAGRHVYVSLPRRRMLPVDLRLTRSTKEMRGMENPGPSLLDASDTIIHGNRVPCLCSVLRMPRGCEWGLRLRILGLFIPLLLLEATLGLPWSKTEGRLKCRNDGKRWR